MAEKGTVVPVADVPSASPAPRGRREPGLDDVLYSTRPAPFRYADLREFLVQEHSEENIDFWGRVEEFKQVFTRAPAPKPVRVSPVTPKSAEETSREIATKFVEAGAPAEVNLSATMRDGVLAKLQSGDKESAFDEAQGEVRLVMERDSFQRFLRSVLSQNITTKQASWRKSLSVLYIGLGLVLTGIVLALEFTDVLGVPFARLVNLVPFEFGFGYYISGVNKVCPDLAAKGCRMREGQAHRWIDVLKSPTSDDVLDDDFAQQRLRALGRRLWWQSKILAVLASVVILLLPIGANDWYK